MFKRIPQYQAQEIIDIAFAKASKVSGKNKKKVEISKVYVSGKTIQKKLETIVKRYPSFDKMDSFVMELIDVLVGVDLLKKNLGGISWGAKTVENLRIEYLKKMKGERDTKRLVELRKQCYARYASILKQIRENLEFLNKAREKLKKMPQINPNPFTIAIAGYPNVGKTSLLMAITGSMPEIASYPFTTKGINVSYFKHRHQKIQVLDTPGLLDRRLEERNKIELQAILALKHVADLIVFVFDSSETCGYEIENQKNLLLEIEKAFELPIVVVNNKSDLKEMKGILNISCKNNKNINVLKMILKEKIDVT